MAAHGKNIQLFLMDGDAAGRIKCTLANWTGVAFKIPRTELDKCKDRDDLKQSDVYFLFGTSDETGKNVVYIGQASNNSLGPTEISYLENRFCNMALKAKRYEVKNGNDPTPGNITEEKESEMEEFIDYAKVIMGTLGHKVFEPLNKPVIAATQASNDTVTEDAIELHLERTIKNVGKVEANGKQTAEGFVVLQGSSISPVDDDTVPAVIKERRVKAQLDEHHILQEDLLFSSPSYAAMFVIGKSANGLTSWKTVDGKTLKSLESEQSAD